MVNHALESGDASLVPESGQTKQVAAPVRAATPLGDLDALYAAYRPRLFRYFLMALRDSDAAESLTQDTFIKAWRNQAGFRGECAPFTWLMRIAVNLLRDHVRGGKYKFWRKAANDSVDAQAVAEVLPSGGTSVEGAMISRERVATLWDAVGRLSERQRSVFLLRYVEEMDLAEIAETMKMPLATVKTHLYRGLERVRAEMRSAA